MFSGSRLTMRWVLLMLALVPLLMAGQCNPVIGRNAENGPVFLPPLDSHLTATLLDVFLQPGFTGR